MREIEERGAEAVIDDAIAEALDGARLGLHLGSTSTSSTRAPRPAPARPEPGGLLTRELLRAVRRIAGAVELAGMDIVEVSPPYDHAEVNVDGREPRGARGDQRARGEAARRPATVRFERPVWPASA